MADLYRQKKESADVKIGLLKFTSLRSRKKKECYPPKISNKAKMSALTTSIQHDAECFSHCNRVKIEKQKAFIFFFFFFFFYKRLSNWKRR